MPNPIINRKRVHGMFAEAGLKLTADAKEFLEAHCEEFIEELVAMFEEGDKITGENITEAYYLLIPPLADDEETDGEDTPTLEATSENGVVVDNEDLNLLKRIKQLRPDVLKHAFALNDLIIEEAKIVAQRIK